MDTAMSSKRHFGLLENHLYFAKLLVGDRWKIKVHFRLSLQGAGEVFSFGPGMGGAFVSQDCLKK